MRKLLLLPLLFSALICFSQKKKNTPSPDPLKGIDQVMEQILKDRKGVGFAVAVIYKDSILYAKGFGYRDLEKKLPVTPHTLFAIGSCTKAFTSTLIGQLQQEGKLDYNKPVRQYLPELEFFNEDMNRMVTLRDMMSHRTGLPRHDYAWYLFKNSSRDSLLKKIKYQEPTEPLRQTWQYNNFMFLAQGMVAEKLTGKTWEKNIQDKIFKPLGMTASQFSVKQLEKNSNASLGYTVVKDSIQKKLDYYNIDAMGPAGSINSNVLEMSAWLKAWILGGKFKDQEVIPASYLQEAISSQMIMRGALPDKEIPDAHFSTYGFGWMLSSYRGHYRVEHGGNIDGFSANACFFPSDSIGIVVLTNQNASSIPGIVRNTLADRLLKLNPIDWNNRANEAEAKAKKAAKESETVKTSAQIKGTQPSRALKFYEGLFNHPGYGTLEVVLRNDSLILLSSGGDAWLKHFHYDVFLPVNIDPKEGLDTAGVDENGLKIQYLMDVHGSFTGLTAPLEPSLKPLVFSRIPKPRSLQKEDLEKYVGEYEFAPNAVVKFYLKGENTLYAFLQGQPEYELLPTDPDEFKLKVLDGYSVQFEKDETGKIIAATFVQPNGKFKATRKK